MMRIVLIVTLLFSVNLIWAQENAKAKRLLDEVSQKTRSFESIAADFTFTMTNEEMTDINEKYEGSIKIKGKKYMVNIPEYGVKIISNGNTLWNYMETGNQVTISSVDEEGSELMDPSSLFTIYEKGFSSKYIDEKSKNGKKVHEIELYPDGDQYGVAKIVVFINSSTLLIDSAVLNELEGNKYTIEVEKMETNHSFPDSDFTFDATEYPDVEVIDFR